MCHFFKTMLLHYFFRSVRHFVIVEDCFFFFSPPDDIFNSKMLLSSSNLRCFQLNKVSQNPLMSSIVAIKVKEDKNTQEVTVSLASLARLAWRLLLVAAFYL